MNSPDIIKGVFYDRGTQTLDGKTKYFTLVGLIIASDKPLVDKQKPEVIVMGTTEIFNALQKLDKYALPYKMGDLVDAMIGVSRMAPEELDKL